MTRVIIAFVIAFIAFEIVEHVVLPLIWLIKGRNKTSDYGVAGLVGKVVEIKRWNKTDGQVSVNGELWRAVCDVPLTVGGRAVIVDIEGLTLMVKPYETRIVESRVGPEKTPKKNGLSI